MKNLVVILVLVFVANTAKSQLLGQAKIDSLLSELPKIEKDTNGVNLLKNLSINYRYIDQEKGIDFGKKGIQLSEDIGWNIGSAKCLYSIAINYIKLFDFNNAETYLLKSLKIYEDEGNMLGKANVFSSLSEIYYEKSDYTRSLEYHFKSLKIDEEFKNNYGIANNLGNIGNIFLRQSDYSQALEYYKKALKINKELGDKSGIASNYSNIGLIYDYKLDYSNALKYYHKALKIDTELDYKKGIIIILSNIGGIYKRQSNYQKALEYFEKSLKLSEELNSKKEIASSLGSLGSFYLTLSKDADTDNLENTSQIVLDKEVNLNKATEYILKSINIFKDIENLAYLSNYYELLSEAYQLKGDYKKAYEAYQEYKTLNDSVFNLDKAKDFATLEAKRENELKEREIIILKKEKENEKLQRYAMFGGIAGLGVIIGLILIQRRKSEKLLLNVLPYKIAKRLKAKEHPIADHFDGASIMFIDIVGFTKLSSDADPKRIVSVLNDIFTIFDKLADTYGLEKIKTIGDSYMAVCGIPEINTNHAKQTALMALEIKKVMANYTTSDGTEIHFRIGIDCGPVVAGVIGEKKFIYDLWSDAVNTASRMESTGEKGKIQITENFKEELEKYAGDWKFELRGEFDIKGKGIMKTYYLEN